jgi:hypothetical protein
MKTFIVMHPSTITTIVEAESQAEAIRIAAEEPVAWFPSDDVFIYRDELDAQEVE